MIFEGKKISVLGLGRSGIALTKILKQQGADILVSDEKESANLVALSEDLKGLGVNVELGGHSDAVYLDKDLIVVSPGVSVYHPVLEEARKMGVAITGEIEIAYQLCRAPIIAVTGTNGKSTTVSLIHRVLSNSGKDAILAGNIGTPLVSEICEHPETRWIVAEISSFQLETIRQFHPRIGVILNITDDHLDRHRNLQEYIAQKARLFENQNPEDYAVLNLDDVNIRTIMGGIKSRKFYFSSNVEVEKGIFEREGSLYWKDGLTLDRVLSLEEIPLSGRHNLENVMAVVTAAKILGISNEVIKGSLPEFYPLNHRIEYVAKVKGVAFYDDSKGTNPAAVIAAIENFRQPIILIAGGKDKDMDFSRLGEVIAEKVKALVVIGETAQKIAASAARYGMTRIITARSLNEAVSAAFESAAGGDIVLLSPACASFDMFKSAENRGDMFKEIVKELEVACS